jgi:hypothetical protein
MNPWDLDATGLMIWGMVAHFVADWTLQNEWMALNKMKRRTRTWFREWGGTKTYDGPWWDRHPAAYVHAGIHLALLSIVFGWPAILLAISHLLIDLRWPVIWWQEMMKQTKPEIGSHIVIQDEHGHEQRLKPGELPTYGIGVIVRIWNDFVWHILVIAIAAILIG